MKHNSKSKQICLTVLITIMLMVVTGCPAGVSKIKHKVTFAVDSGNGKINAKIGGKNITSNSMMEDGTIISFTVVPNANYETENWTITGGKTISGGDAGSIAASVKITADTYVTVSFKQMSGNHPPAKPPFTGTAEEREKIIFERLMNASLRFEKTADVSEFGISTIHKTGGGDHKQIYNKFIKTYPFIFHIVEDGSLSHNYNPKNENELAKYIFDYKIHSDFETYFKKFEAAFEDFYSRLREGMSDAEIAYVLHNALAEKTEYVEVMHSDDTLGPVINGKAICQGYSLAYRRLLLGLGINADYIFGPTPQDPSGHMWNSIQLDGDWYNADLTWDDEQNAPERAISHSKGKYFLTSDRVFYDVNGHPRPEANALAPAAVSTKYDSDNCIFRNGDDKTEPIYHEGYWYYLSHTDKTVYKSRFNGTEKQALHILNDKNPRRNYVYKRLELGAGGLYFMDIDPADNSASKKDFIYRINYDGTGLQKIREISFGEACENKTLVQAGDALTLKKGKNALRGEIMLSKMKDAYYHGTEDYFKPKSEERKAFVEAIKKAETLVKQTNVSDNEAKVVYDTLHDIRKNYIMECSCPIAKR